MQITLPLSLLEEAAAQADLENDDIRTDYSGRAMYDAECVGVVGNVNCGTAFVVELLELAKDWGGEGGLDGLDYDELKDVLLRGMRSDNMGMSMIYYWPDLVAA